MKATRSTIDGYELRFLRRGYGRRVFTYVEANIDGTWVDFGDPWPGKPKADDLRHSLAWAVFRHRNPNATAEEKRAFYLAMQAKVPEDVRSMGKAIQAAFAAS